MHTMLYPRNGRGENPRPRSLGTGSGSHPRRHHALVTRLPKDVGHESGNYGSERKPVKWTAVGSGLRLPLPAVT
jgi:hypothetical protein